MRVPSRLLISVLLAAAPAISQAPARTAADIPSIKESHEGFTVEAAPWTSKEHYKARFPKKTFMDGGAIAIDVVLRNDSDQPLHVNLNRIRLLLLPPESDRQQIYPLSPADLADLVFHPAAKQPTAPRSRVPLPIPRTGSGAGKASSGTNSARRPIAWPSAPKWLRRMLPSTVCSTSIWPANST